jgi:hypothetical protein
MKRKSAAAPDFFSAQVRIIAEFDSDSGETGVYLFCPSCRQCERLPMI